MPMKSKVTIVIAPASKANRTYTQNRRATGEIKWKHIIADYLNPGRLGCHQIGLGGKVGECTHIEWSGLRSGIVSNLHADDP